MDSVFTPIVDSWCHTRFLFVLSCERWAVRALNAGDQTLQDVRFLWQHRKESGCCHVGIHALVWRGRGML